MGKSIRYINDIGISVISKYENNLIEYAQNKLLNIKGVELYSPINDRGPTLTFNFKEIHSYDLTTILDKMGIAIRSGHHCAQPLMHSLNISSSNRISLCFYNTEEEVDKFFISINKALKILL